MRATGFDPTAGTLCSLPFLNTTVMITCKHCGRILTHPVYEYLGEGATCRETHTHKQKPNDKGARGIGYRSNLSVVAGMLNAISDAGKRDRVKEKLLHSP